MIMESTNREMDPGFTIAYLGTLWIPPKERVLKALSSKLHSIHEGYGVSGLIAHFEGSYVHVISGTPSSASDAFSDITADERVIYSQGFYAKHAPPLAQRESLCVDMKSASREDVDRLLQLSDAISMEVAVMMRSFIHNARKLPIP